MKKKLPKVFANEITRKINNNEKVYTTKEEKENNTNIKEKDLNKKIQNKTIDQKINEIINTKKYIYKIPVVIITQEKEIKTKIIGKNNKNVITMDNELIEISKIKEIYIDE